MVKTNVKAPRTTHRTFEGAPASRVPLNKPELQLRRVVMASMLFEDQFYIDGVSSADIIASAAATVDPMVIAKIAIEAREKQKLRHVPLFLVRELARRKDLPWPGLVSETLASVIQRADEIPEFLALYWRDKRQPLSAQVKKGLALAFQKFDAYALAKYNRDSVVKLRDALFLCHAKPRDEEQAAVWKKLVDGTLESPDTWEVAISAANGPEEKRSEWTRLLNEGKLFALALLRNLRNMKDAGVPDALVRSALATMKTERVLPFRFISAARVMPMLEDALETAMFKCLAGAEKFPGRTVVMVDVSGSMDGPISAKSDLTRMDAACGVAMLLREVCETVAVISFSDTAVGIAPRRGFALREAIIRSQSHQGTYTGAAINIVNQEPHDRIVIITDEQTHDVYPSPITPLAYVINVGAYKNGVGYGKWNHIDGWSEACIDYIRAVESTDC